MRSLPTGELILENCRVPAAAVLGPVGGALAVIGPFAGLAAIGAASMAVGIAQAAVDRTRGYLVERTVAGQPLAAHPVVQAKFADMLIELNAARALLYRAIWDRDQGPPGPIPTVFQAKIFATERALRIVDQAIQLHGMYGYSTEFPLEKYYRDLRGWTIQFGVNDVLRGMTSQIELGLMPH